jgi:type IX secretion system PorP/SprF family membrane protein
MFKRFLIIGVFIIVEVAVAQQEGMFSQYMYNPSALNTAYTGTRDETILYFQYRSQWNSFEGAPRSSYFNYQKQGAKKLSTGISIMQESSGPMNQLTAGIDLAYKIQLSGDSFMSFGIKPMIDYLDVNFNSLNIYNPQDPWFDINIDQKLSPNLGLGVFYYDDRGYIGLSTSGILSTKHFDQSSPTSYLAADRAHYYLMAGKVLELNDNILFKPSFLMRMVKGVPISADISANIRIDDKVETGLSYRISGALSALAAFRVNRNVLVGYSYDKEIGYIGNFTGGSSELFVRYELLPKTIKTIVKPRFF